MKIPANHWWLCQRKQPQNWESYWEILNQETVGADKEESRGLCTGIMKNKIWTKEEAGRELKENWKFTQKKRIPPCKWRYTEMWKNRLGCHFDLYDFSLGEAACLIIKLFWNLQELPVNQCYYWFDSNSTTVCHDILGHIKGWAACRPLATAVLTDWQGDRQRACKNVKQGNKNTEVSRAGN